MIAANEGTVRVGYFTCCRRTPMVALPTVASQLMQTAASITRIRNFLSLEELEDDKHTKTKRPKGPCYIIEAFQKV